METSTEQPNVSTAIARFWQLHETGCFLLPNPWDAGSAKILEHLGFKALASTSAGVAFARGLPDTLSSLSRDGALDNLRQIMAVTTLPVNADFQNGFAHQPEGVAENVRLCVGTGVAGLSIEDATGEESEPLYDLKLAIERIKAARAAIDSTKTGVVLTARCEAWLVGDPKAFQTAIERLVAYSEAGADCLYAPGVKDTKEIEAIVKAVAPKPVNVLMSSPVPGLSVSVLQDLGVRRISLGSALSRVAWGAFTRASKNIIETGTFDSLSEAASFAELNRLFE